MSKSTNNDIRHSLWEVLQRTNTLLVKYVDVKFLEENEISYQQFLVLLMMDRIGVAATGSQIANMLERNPNTLSMILDRMMDAGLVQRERNMKDRRLVRIVMTQKGKNKLKKTAESGWKIIEQLTETFTQEELETFISLTKKLETQAYKILVPKKATKQAQSTHVKIK